MHWNELVKLALLGTDRSSLSPAMKAELQGYGIDTDKEITEVILESAALYAPLQKAGYEPRSIHIRPYLWLLCHNSSPCY